jgi:hypothetical protein
MSYLIMLAVFVVIFGIYPNWAAKRMPEHRSADEIKAARWLWRGGKVRQRRRKPSYLKKPYYRKDRY